MNQNNVWHLNFWLYLTCLYLSEFFANPDNEVSAIRGTEETCDYHASIDSYIPARDNPINLILSPGEKLDVFL